jgi:hypothetical protein
MNTLRRIHNILGMYQMRLSVMKIFFKSRLQTINKVAWMSTSINLIDVGDGVSEAL